jgi:hypothetical protein
MGEPRRLPIPDILLRAARLPVQEWRAFLRGLAVPGTALVAFYVAWWEIGRAGTELGLWGQWGIYLFFLALYLIFALTTHRLALLEAQRRSGDILPPFTRREARFTGYVLFAGIACGGISLVTTAGMAMVLAIASLPGLGPEVMYWAHWIGYAAGMYVFCRLAPTFPAAAIDRPMNVRDAWSLSRENGWRLLILIGAVPLVLDQGTAWIYQKAPNVSAVIAASIVMAILLAFEVCVLSLSYRELVGEETQPPL